MRRSREPRSEDTQGQGSAPGPAGGRSKASLGRAAEAAARASRVGEQGVPPREQGEGPTPKAEGRHPFIPGSDAPAESPGLGLTGQEPSSHSGHSREGPTEALAPPGDPWEARGLNGDPSWRAPGAMPAHPAALSPTGRADADSAPRPQQSPWGHLPRPCPQSFLNTEG